MKKRTSLLLGLLACSVQVYAQAPQFTGFYANLGLGGALLNLDITDNMTVVNTGFLDLDFPYDAHAEGTGIAALIGVGYSYQLDNSFVLGAEFTAGMSASASYMNEVVIAGNSLASSIESNLKNDFALLLKPGYVFKERTQIYVLAGPRWGHFESELTTHTITSGVHADSNSYELGITAGIGLIHLLTEHVSFGLEYAYTSYDDIFILENEYDISAPGIGDATVADHSEVQASTHSMMATLSYYF